MNGYRDSSATLLCDGRPVAKLEVAASPWARYRGLLGRDGLDGAILLVKTNGVHTFGMRFPLDVAYLTRDLRVITIVQMKVGRFARPRLHARHTLEASRGSLAQWGIEPGAQLGIDDRTSS